MINKGLFFSQTCEWATPQALYDDLDCEFHFTLDACATAENAKCQDYYSEGALEKPWVGVVWCNPPYGREIGKWIHKGRMEAEAGSVVVMLIPSRTDTRWWHDDVMKASEIRYVKGRLKFNNAKYGAPFPSAIVVFRKA